MLRGKPAWTLRLLLGCALVAACSDEDATTTRKRNNASSSSSGGPADPNDPTQGGAISAEEAKFRAVEADLVKTCGKGCHDAGGSNAPTFLAPPDVYKSIKAHNGIVVRDVYTSLLLTKGSHAGPALNQEAELEKKVVEWLEAEAIVIQSQKLPTTPPFTVQAGANEVNLSPAATNGLTGVKLKFDAQLIDGILSLSGISVVVPVGPDVHILHPRFVRVLAQPKEDGSTDVDDPADSFSNSDQTIANGKEESLSPGSVLFSADSWRPFDLASDKLRIEATKLEPGKLDVVKPAATCKDVQGFANNVLPTLRNQQTSVGNNCQGCHGGGLGGMNLSSNDNGLVCQQVLGKLNQGNLAQSLIVTKVTGGTAHNGGTVPDTNAWRNLFQNNAGVFF